MAVAGGEDPDTDSSNSGGSSSDNGEEKKRMRPPWLSEKVESKACSFKDMLCNSRVEKQLAAFYGRDAGRMLSFAYQLTKMGSCNAKARELVQSYLDRDAEELVGAVLKVLFLLQVREQLLALRVLREVERYVKRTRMDQIIEKQL